MSALKFGKYKGREISELANDTDGAKYLDWLRTEKIDVNDPKYGDTNRKMLDEINRALDGKTIYVNSKPSRKEQNKESREMPQALPQNKVLDTIVLLLNQTCRDLQLIKTHLKIENLELEDNGSETDF